MICTALYFCISHKSCVHAKHCGEKNKDCFLVVEPVLRVKRRIPFRRLSNGVLNMNCFCVTDIAIFVMH